MDLEQCNFLAENELLIIKPRFTQDMIEAIGGQYGPFEAGVPLSVPVWIAVSLRKRQRCTIVPPDWLNVEDLKAISQAEADTASFSKIPEHFFVITHILITQCKEDLDNLEQLRTLVKDIWDKRSSKLRTSTMQSLEKSEAGHVQIDNITQFEVAHCRDFFIDASSTIGKLSGIFLSMDET